MPYSKIPTIVFSDWFNVESILEKIYQAVATRNEQVNLQPTLNKVGGGVSLTNFVTYCLKKKKLNRFFKGPEKIFWKSGSKRGLYRHVYYLNLGLCGTSSSKHLTNKKQENLKVTFCIPTEPHHCKSSVNDTVYSEVFLEPSLKWFLTQKLWIRSNWETHL